MQTNSGTPEIAAIDENGNVTYAGASTDARSVGLFGVPSWPAGANPAPGPFSLSRVQPVEQPQTWNDLLKGMNRAQRRAFAKQLRRKVRR